MFSDILLIRPHCRTCGIEEKRNKRKPFRFNVVPALRSRRVCRDEEALISAALSRLLNLVQELVCASVNAAEVQPTTSGFPRRILPLTPHNTRT